MPMLIHRMAIESYLQRTLRMRDKEARRTPAFIFVRRPPIMECADLVSPQCSRGSDDVIGPFDGPPDLGHEMNQHPPRRHPVRHDQVEFSSHHPVRQRRPIMPRNSVSSPLSDSERRRAFAFCERKNPQLLRVF